MCVEHAFKILRTDITETRASRSWTSACAPYDPLVAPHTTQNVDSTPTSTSDAHGDIATLLPCTMMLVLRNNACMLLSIVAIHNTWRLRYAAALLTCTLFSCRILLTPPLSSRKLFETTKLVLASPRPCNRGWQQTYFCFPVPDGTDVSLPVREENVDVSMNACGLDLS